MNLFSPADYVQRYAQQEHTASRNPGAQDEDMDGSDGFLSSSDDEEEPPTTGVAEIS